MARLDAENQKKEKDLDLPASKPKDEPKAFVWKTEWTTCGMLRFNVANSPRSWDYCRGDLFCTAVMLPRDEDP